MTIGSSSRKSSMRSSIRAPKFLDKSSGFYGRLDEPEDAREAECVEIGIEDSTRERVVISSPSPTEVSIPGEDKKEEAEAFDYDEGMMEGDGETLLWRKASRRSSRWRRSSRRKHKEGRAEEAAAPDQRPSLGMESPEADPHVLVVEEVTIEVEMEKSKTEDGEVDGGKEDFAHFLVKEDADDRVLIRDKKRGREEEEEGEEERRMKREQEEGMKVVKRKSLKNYGKVLDRAFRRGWEAFVTNLYSVTINPVTSSSPPSPSPASKSKQKLAHSSVLAEFR